MEALNRVTEGRAIPLDQDIGPDFDDVVGSHANKEPVEGRVVQSAKGKSVGDIGLSPSFRVGNDVRGVKEFVVSELAQRALMSISA